MKSKNYPTLDVLSATVAAYDHTDRIIVRTTTHNNGNRIDSNRQLVTDYLEGNGAPFVVNDFHRKEADGIVQYLQQTVIMQSLKGTPDRFLAQVVDLLSGQTVATRDFGIVAWAPKLADDYQRKDHVREISARYEHHSRYVGHVRDKITTDFTLIEKRYIKSMDCWAVYGYDSQDNLLFYWARSLDRVCETGRITARIKDHRKDEYRGNALVTVLNYVKVL
jgi:hypothetical protein